jgi:hypothetical protein
MMAVAVIRPGLKLIAALYVVVFVAYATANLVIVWDNDSPGGDQGPFPSEGVWNAASYGLLLLVAAGFMLGTRKALVLPLLPVGVFALFAAFGRTPLDFAGDYQLEQEPLGALFFIAAAGALLLGVGMGVAWLVGRLRSGRWGSLA